MAVLDDLIEPVSQATYLRRLLEMHTANKVPVKAWTSPRNVGLSITQISAQFFAELRKIVAETAAGGFLSTAKQKYLTLFAKSQYQVTRASAEFASGIVTLTLAPTAPAWSFGAGALCVGTPGPTLATARTYVNTESGAIQKGKISIPGKGNGLTLERKSTGVTLRIVVAGTNTALTVPPVVAKEIVVNQSTDADGNPTGTAAQIIAKINAEASAIALVTPTQHGTGGFVLGSMPLSFFDEGVTLLEFQATQSGALGNIPIGAALELKTSFPGVIPSLVAWKGGTWLVTHGADEETDERLATFAVSRWGTLGVAANVDGFLFWALATPNGYTRSPVAHAVVWSGYSNDTYAAGATVVVIGPAGALGAGDIAAVQDNFENPVQSVVIAGVPGLDTLGKKYPIGHPVKVMSAVNKTINVTGTVYIRRKANVASADVAAAVTLAIAKYQSSLTMGQTIYPVQKLEGVVSQASPMEYAIERVDLSPMGTSVVQTKLQYPVLSISGLSYVQVDA